MNPAKAAKVRHIFDNAPFIREMGVELTSIEDGWCETQLVPDRRHRQQHGLIHAGVMATMCDHTAGCAARGKVGLDQDGLTVEFKINFLRPALADRLRSRSHVLRAGKTLVICESEVYAKKESAEKLVAKATVTLAVTGEVVTREQPLLDVSPLYRTLWEKAPPQLQVVPTIAPTIAPETAIPMIAYRKKWVGLEPPPRGGSTSVSARDSSRTERGIGTTTGTALSSTSTMLPATQVTGAPPVGVTLTLRSKQMTRVRWAVDPSGKYVYVTNHGTGDVSAYSIDANSGALTEVGTFAAGTGPHGVAVAQPQ